LHLLHTIIEKAAVATGLREFAKLSGSLRIEGSGNGADQ